MGEYRSSSKTQTSVRMSNKHFSYLKKLAEKYEQPLNTVIVRMILQGIEFERYCEENREIAFEEIRRDKDPNKTQAGRLGKARGQPGLKD